MSLLTITSLAKAYLLSALILWEFKAKVSRSSLYHWQYDCRCLLQLHYLSCIETSSSVHQKITDLEVMSGRGGAGTTAEELWSNPTLRVVARLQPNWMWQSESLALMFSDLSNTCPWTYDTRRSVNQAAKRWTKSWLGSSRYRENTSSSVCP